jgi:hypothetical protein
MQRSVATIDRDEALFLSSIFVRPVMEADPAAR